MFFICSALCASLTFYRFGAHHGDFDHRGKGHEVRFRDVIDEG
jgi:hypothetical protein